MLDGRYIYEKSEIDEERFLNDSLAEGMEKKERYVFAKYVNFYEEKICKFLGVYKLDCEKSKSEHCVCWKRISKELDFKGFLMDKEM